MVVTSLNATTPSIYARQPTGLADFIKSPGRMLYRGCLRRDARLRDEKLRVAARNRALDAETRLAGRVFTVQGRPDPTSSVHESVIRWTEFLTAAPEGHVIICQPQDHSLALMGELSAETLHLRGVRGYIVDGGCRDNAFIRKLGFPVFARFQTPRDMAGAWRLESTGQTIEIEGVQIRTGDIVLADIDGIVVVPEEKAEAVIGQVEKVMNSENLVRKAILSGMSPKDAYLKYGKF